MADYESIKDKLIADCLRLLNAGTQDVYFVFSSGSVKPLDGCYAFTRVSSACAFNLL